MGTCGNPESEWPQPALSRRENYTTSRYNTMQNAKAHKRMVVKVTAAVSRVSAISNTRSPVAGELWLNLVFEWFEGWRRIWLNCCCETACLPKEIHPHGNDEHC